ncbi:MAG: hypothetical protein ACE5K9_04415 [Candidatus Methylomirabilales bacterium]
MFKHRRLSLVAIGHFLFFIVTAAPHTVHHGLHIADTEECPVYAITTQTTGDLPDILTLPSLLLLTNLHLIFDLVLPERFTPQVYKSRAPPLTLPA